MRKRIFSLVSIIVGLVLIHSVTFAAAPFYEGKTMRIIVGTSAGGGFDAHARVIARHMGKHIPGNPTIIVENMVGGGGLISANHLYKVAKPDGLTIGHFNGSLFSNQVMGEPGIEFDARKFEFIGAPMTDDVVFAFTKASGITSVEKWMASKTPVKMGGVTPGATLGDNAMRIAKVALGLPSQLISGYAGTADIRLACENGEVAGAAWAWNTMKVAWRNRLETGDVVVVLQAVRKPFPDLPKVPLAINLAKTDEARQLIEAGIHSPGVFGRPLALPPGTPKERVEMLRKAFQETMKDKEFLAETEKSKLTMDPVTAEELQRSVAGIFKLDSALLAKMRDIIVK
jgi:tripartite-type tricarboxylate transporter receptor subunit TctC